MFTSLLIILCIIGELNAVSQKNNFEVPLHDLEKYAATIPEFPDLKDPDWIDPDYSEFHNKIAPSLVKRMLQKTHILSTPIWTPELFAALIDTVTEYRTTMEFDKKTTAVISAAQDSKIFVWGDVHAAFHSLMRDLIWLETQKIIDSNLKILDQNTFFVFHGDAISRGVYSMETLTVILLLMHHNPHNVFYVTGKHESMGYWQNFGLKRELRARAYHIDRTWLPLANQINTFFKTLVIELYINMIEDPQHCILFKFNGLDLPYRRQPSIQQKPGVFYSEPFEKYQYKTDGCFIIDVLLKTEDWIQEHRTRDGLGLFDQSYGATTWAVLSSPISMNIQYYDFKYDAFTTIKIGKTIRTSTIATNIRSIQATNTNFETKIACNIVTGRAITSAQPDPVGDDIVIGSTMSLIQGIPVMGERVKRGASLAINKANRDGGIHGRHIKFDVRNDNYIPHFARQNINEFITSKITDIILAPIGSPTLDAYTDFITDNKIAVLFPITGGVQFSNPKLASLVNLTSMYSDEIKLLIDYIIKQHATRKFAFFYQQDEYEEGGMSVVREILPKYGIKEWLELPYTRGSINFEDQIRLLKEKQVDALGFLSTSYAAEEFIRQIDLERLNNRTLFGLSFLGDESFRGFVDDKGLKVLLSARVPNPHISTLPVIKEYREMMEGYSYLTDTASLEGYIAAKLTITIMKQMEGEITKDTLIKYIDTIKDLNFDGFKLTFDPKIRSFNNHVWLETGRNTAWLER
jgi:branched-chain amino acid transport system substrate-binding protein